MPRMTFREAIRSALAAALSADERVLLLGEDIGGYGGAFKVTSGLIERFGPDRVIETPISENSFAGVATGLAMTGYRPVVEFMFMDFMALAIDQICNHAAKVSHMYAGQFSAPVVYRAPFGGGFGYGPSHSQALEAWFCHTPGLKVVAPATPRAARGLMLGALRQNCPVVFLEHKALYNLAADVPEDDGALDIGTGCIVRAGSDITVAGYGRTVWLAVEAARRLHGRVRVEVLDLRSLAPIDRPLLLASARKTGRLVMVEDDCLSGGVGAEVVAIVAEQVAMRAPMRRVACADVPMPCCAPLERAALPNVERVVQAVLEVMEGVDGSNNRHPEDRRERHPRNAGAMVAARG